MEMFEVDAPTELNADIPLTETNVFGDKPLTVSDVAFAPALPYVPPDEFNTLKPSSVEELSAHPKVMEVSPIEATVNAVAELGAAEGDVVVRVDTVELNVLELPPAPKVKILK